MVLDEVNVDGDEFADLLPALEQSFGVTLPHNLIHVQTVGDLFDEILRHRTLAGEGDRCDTAMAFFLLRRSLAAQGLDDRAHPAVTLSAAGLGSPRRVRERVARETGLELPPLVMTMRGCAFIAVLTLVALAFLLGDLWAASILAIIGVYIAVRRDSGAWKGDWATLGSLARATAIRNVMRLGVRGARGSQTDWWRSFVALVVDSRCATSDGKGVAPEEVGVTTRFRFT